MNQDERVIDSNHSQSNTPLTRRIDRDLLLKAYCQVIGDALSSQPSHLIVPDEVDFAIGDLCSKEPKFLRGNLNSFIGFLLSLIFQWKISIQFGTQN